MEKIPNLREFFQEHQSDLNKLETERLETLRDLRTTTFTIGGIVVLLLAGLIYSQKAMNSEGIKEVIIYIFVAFIFILAFTFFLRRNHIIRDYQRSYKKKVIAPLITRLDPGFHYQAEPKERYYYYNAPEMAHIPGSMLFDHYTAVYPEDFIRGTIRQNEFELSEIKLIITGDDSSKTVFKGLCMKIMLNVTLPASMHIVPDLKNRMTEKPNSDYPLLRKSKPARIPVKHDGFNQIFKVFSNDATVAGALLTRSFLESVLKINQQVNEINPAKNTLAIAMKDNMVMIAVKVKETLFEPNLKEPINNVKFLERSFQYLVLMLGMVGELNLSNDKPSVSV